MTMLDTPEQINMFRMAVLIKSIEAYTKTGMLLTRVATPAISPRLRGLFSFVFCYAAAPPNYGNKNQDGFNNCVINHAKKQGAS